MDTTFVQELQLKARVAKLLPNRASNSSVAAQCYQGYLDRCSVQGFTIWVLLAAETPFTACLHTDAGDTAFDFFKNVVTERSTPSIITILNGKTPGIPEGGKVGLMEVTTGFTFSLLAFFSSILSSIPSWAPGGVLVIVGTLMIRNAREINRDYIGDAFPLSSDARPLRKVQRENSQLLNILVVASLRNRRYEWGVWMMM
ncbi:hypothetical protein BC827DRAFT_1381514 [Russula dissimulans]|nr:hypothetical protein BC827DRAFT_1381514 [Russula dissimulans]